MKETEHVGAFYCLSLVLEFGDVSVTEKKKACEEEKARFLLLSPISFSWVPRSALLQNISEVSQIIFTPYKELHVHDEGGQSLILRGDCRDCRTTKCHLRQKSLS